MISGPQQAHDVAEDREPEAREDLLGDGRAAEHVALLEDERLHPGAGEVGGADEAVVAATDDDRVVGLGQGMRPPRLSRLHTFDARIADPTGPSSGSGGRLPDARSDSSPRPVRSRKVPTRHRSTRRRSGPSGGPAMRTGARRRPATPTGAHPRRSRGRSSDARACQRRPSRGATRRRPSRTRPSRRSATTGGIAARTSRTRRVRHQERRRRKPPRVTRSNRRA